MIKGMERQANISYVNDGKAHLQNIAENREKKSGKTDEQWFANVRYHVVPIFAVEEWKA
jgi:hypothetical protein